MQYWFSAQLRQYRLQFIRAFSNFMVKTGKQGPNGTEELIRVPCRYGDPSRIAATIVAGNSENKAPAVPFISCIINSISMNSNRRQDPQMVEKVQVNERKYDAELGRYTGDIGNRYTVERAMPVPYDLTFQVDIWTNNLDIKEQLIEQILVLYNPAVDIQTSVNPLDWTVLSYIEMQDNITWSSRSIPVGTDNPIDVATLVFKIPIWINPPAKVKKQSIIQQIVTSIVEGFKSPSSMEWDSYQLLARTINTPQEATIRTLPGSDGQLIIELCDETGISTLDQESLPTVTASLPNPSIFAGMSFVWNDHEVNISSTLLDDAVENIRTSIIGSDLNCQIHNKNQLRFINTSGGDNRFSDIVPGSLAALGLVSGNYIGGKLAWWRLLELYGTVRTYTDFGTNASQLRLKTVEDIEQTNTDIVGYIDFDQFDQNRIIWTPDTESYPAQTQVSINAIVDPSVSGPGINLPMVLIGQRYLITEDMAESSASWGSATSRANDIIMFDGDAWKTAWSLDENNPHIEYVLNQKTNRIYKWNGSYWSSLIEPQYLQGYWRLAL
jgi:hypothetical protein